MQTTPMVGTTRPAMYADSTPVDPSNIDPDGLTFEDRLLYEKYSKIDLSEIETRMVKVETVDEHGNIKEVMKEVAICPECGEENCPCIARITVQARLDEENAKGVRNAKKPSPMSIIPQSFNQVSMNLQKTASNAYFR